MIQTKMNGADFIKRLNEKYPNFNWDALPKFDTIPDIYIVEGVFETSGRTSPFQFDVEYTDIGEANKAAERARTFNACSGVKVTPRKSSDACEMDYLNELRLKAIAGEEVSIIGTEI